jgi:cGMP-dependent protein kinase
MFLNSVPLFEILTNEQKERIITNLVLTIYQPGEHIVTEGETGDLFYIIKEGQVRCTKEGREVRTMTKGDYFGEQALLYNCLRTATIEAVSTVICVSIDRESLSNALGSQLQQVIYKNSIKIAIEKSVFLGSLTEDQIESTILAMEIKSFTEG